MPIAWKLSFIASVLDPTQLPSAIKKITLFENRFYGTVDLICTPTLLKYFDLRRNSFCGVVDLVINTFPKPVPRVFSGKQSCYLHAGSSEDTGTSPLQYKPGGLCMRI
ncbi:hypothetical protein XU18_3120 [Perkinsela sp. CCAP 1560/4]|nr:hypothetical protein XU18_3120 [Perkinsela sp. CCAP 1560/4]|eukprot:KNH05958.1 hypothetical protein XU18_3120 [Perkinsela sp. CCAP 1560/4]